MINKIICNRKCFNCEFKDCLNDSYPNDSELKQADETDKDILGLSKNKNSGWHLQGKILQGSISNKLARERLKTLE